MWSLITRRLKDDEIAEQAIADINYEAVADGDAIRSLHKLLYDYVCKENDLLNHRTTWFLAIQSGAILGISYLFRENFQVFYDVLLARTVSPGSAGAQLVPSVALWFLCCALGWLTARAARKSIKAGIIAQLTLSKFWNKYYPDETDRLGLPRLMGGFSPEADRAGAHFADTLTRTMFFGWMGLALAMAVPLAIACLF